jgi:hypothetical protein
MLITGLISMDKIIFLLKRKPCHLFIKKLLNVLRPKGIILALGLGVLFGNSRDIILKQIVDVPSAKYTDQQLCGGEADGIEVRSQNSAPLEDSLHREKHGSGFENYLEGSRLVDIIEIARSLNHL